MYLYRITRCINWLFSSSCCTWWSYRFDMSSIRWSISQYTLVQRKWTGKIALVEYRSRRISTQVTRHRTSPEGNLQIRGASEEEDSGNYTCFVQNTVGSSSVSLRLDVGSKKENSIGYLFICYSHKVPPSIRIPRFQISAEIAEHVQLTCEVFGSPKPHIM